MNDATAGAAKTGFFTRMPPRPLFILTVLVGSFLLFLVQPLFARLALPRLGGAPGVWTVALLFYQAVLLAGYVYAHFLSRLEARTQLFVHLGMFLLAAFTLPIELVSFGRWQEAGPILWLLGLLTVSLGPVFFVVSAQAPLMQAWFARTADKDAANPYFLYAASNAGSLLALILYPALIEPGMALSDQQLLWSGGFVLLAICVGLCGMRVEPGARALAPPPGAEPIDWRRMGHWVLLAAVPSGLMLSTTTHLTTDIVAVPLLWVVPLGIYLLTFIVAFSEGGQIFVRQARFIAAPLLLAIGVYTFLAEGVFQLLLALANLILLFYLALALHGELAATRPAPAHLTRYYILMSLGGMLGGLFAAVVAPLAFDWVYEHPILLVGAAFLLPAVPLLRSTVSLWHGRLSPFLRWVWPLVSLALSIHVHRVWMIGENSAAALPALVVVGLGAVLSIGQRLPFAVHFAALLLGMGGWHTLGLSTERDARTRSFFGIYTVADDEEKGVRQLEHGTTLHGLQSLIPEFETAPLSYYRLESGAGQALSALPHLFGIDARVGIVGLGVGSMICYAQRGQDWTIFEIDPVVVRIARDPELFTYVEACGESLDIVVGDARVQLDGTEDGGFDLLAIDAFSSDAIPQHLMTLEAFELYRRVLAKDGYLLVHISNRHLNLEPVVAAAAEHLGWAAAIYDDRPPEDTVGGLSFARSIWIAMAPDTERLQAMFDAGPVQSDGWRPLYEVPGFTPWTDDYSSILNVLRY